MSEHEHTPTMDHAAGIDTRPTSGVAIASLVLGILFFCLGPLALVPLVLGFIGIMQTGSNSDKKGQGFAIAGVSLGALGLLGIIIWMMFLGIMAPALSAARDQATLLKSQVQVRSILQGCTIYASSNNDQFPSIENWEQVLLDAGIIDQELLVSPVEDGDGVSYIYLGGELSFDANQIVVYEDPKHWPEKGVIVGFADNHVELLPFDIFEQMLAEQQAEQETP